jgi:WD40 repeat protein
MKIELTERVLSRHPLPIADAVAGLEAAENPHERRDRIVAVFRSVIRTLAAYCLAVRLQYGPGPGDVPAQLPELLRTLRRRGLTDGQWVGLIRELLRPWKSTPDTYALPGLVELFHSRASPLGQLIDGLLQMRKAETVAHGAVGDRDEILEVMKTRLPQLEELLEAFEPVWRERPLVVPLSAEEHPRERQRAWSLTGYTPGRGSWRRIDLADGARVPIGQAVLTDPSGRPVVALHPMVLFRRASPDAIEECFFLDGGGKHGARYQAVPSMAEHCEADAWRALEAILTDDEDAGAHRVAGRPYRGLSSFGPEHQDRFFGRERMAEELSNRIRRHPWVTITGPSGCGKTSLLHAGVLPRLRDHEHVVIRPGAQPLDALLRRLDAALASHEGETDLHAALNGHLPALGQALAHRCRTTGRNLLLVVDQGEELLTLCTDLHQQTDFAAAIASAASDPDGPVRVVFSLREDFFGRLATLSPLRGLYTRQVEVVTTPDRDSLIRTLEGPLTLFDHSFESPELASEMADAVAGHPAALALLQFCADCMWDARDRTWRRLTWDAYRSLGGVEGALTSHADRVLEDLSPAQQGESRRLLLRLVTAEDTRAVCRRTELLEVAEDAASAGAVLDRLVEARLVLAGESEDGGADSRVELVHEALIRHWGRLKQWIADGREGRRTLMALRNAAQEWESRGRPRGLLWRDEVLEEYRVWARRVTPRLTARERGFADASLAEEARVKRLRRGVGAGTAVLGLIFGALMHLQWRAAEARATEARTQTIVARDAQAKALVGQLQATARLLRSEGLLQESAALWRAATVVESDGNAGTAQLSPSRFGLMQSAPAALGLVLTGFDGASSIHDRFAYSRDGRTLVVDGTVGDVNLIDLATGRSTPVPSDGRTQYTLDLSADSTALATLLCDNGPDVRSRCTARIVDLPSTGNARTLSGPDHSFILTGSFSPDGRVFATSSEGHPSVRLWDAKSGQMRHTLTGHKEDVINVAFSPDGSTIATASRDGAVKLWNVATGALTRTLSGHTQLVQDIAFRADGGMIATVSRDRTVKLWEAATGRLVANITGHTDAVLAAEFSPDGGMLATASMDSTARLWSASTGDTIRVLSEHKGAVSNLAFHPNGHVLVTTSYDGTAILWEVASGRAVRTMAGHRNIVTNAQFNLQGDALVTASNDGTLRLWRSEGLHLNGSAAPIGTIAFSPNGSSISACTTNGSVAQWDARSGAPLRTFEVDVSREGRFTYGGRIALTSDGSAVAALAADGSLRLRDVASGELRHMLTGPKVVHHLGFSPDGSLLYAASSEAVWLWDTATGRLRRRLDGKDFETTISETPLQTFALSKDARMLGFVEEDGSVTVLEVGSGAISRRVRPPMPDFYNGGPVAISLDAKHLASAHGMSVHLWDDQRPESLHVLTSEGAVETLNFDPTGRILLSARESEVVLWDTETGLAVRRFTQSIDNLTVATLSPDGKFVATGSRDGTVKLWDVTSGQLVLTFTDRISAVRSAAFSSDGKMLASGAEDGQVTVRDLRYLRMTLTELLAATGGLTNLRVCRDTLKVIPLLPLPPAETVWVEDVLGPAEATERCAR